MLTFIAALGWIIFAVMIIAVVGFGIFYAKFRWDMRKSGDAIFDFQHD